MANKRIPILLSFYALSNGETTLTFGQITYTSLKDFSFVDYGTRKTFKTLIRLYRTRAYANRQIVLKFTTGIVEANTNRYGAFYVKSEASAISGRLERVALKSGDDVRIVEGLYARAIDAPKGDTFVVSDIDDTLVHSFINDRLMQFRTLMFTSMEKRKAVVDMQALLMHFVSRGAVPVYLSNSEQNLYPLIYRFLKHNSFPEGPLFLKHLRRLRDVLLNVKMPPRNTHKVMMLAELFEMFPNRKFILMGDNTQSDVAIYLSAAEKYGDNIRYIIIRRVLKRRSGEKRIAEAARKLAERGVGFYYADEFPKTF